MRNTICAKHDYILKICNVQIRYINKYYKLDNKECDTCNELIELINDCISVMENVCSETEDAKSDGQRMEDGLRRKNDIIAKLEAQINN